MSKWVRVFGGVLLGLVLGSGIEVSAITSTGSAKHHSSGTTHVSAKGKIAMTSKSTKTTKKTSVARTGSKRRGARTKLAVRRTRYYEHFSASSFADNLTLGDTTDGEDPIVRAAAIEALGNMNGTALAIDPSNGRILAMVNQKLALSRGAEPCSTIKLTVALAALEEGIVKGYPGQPGPKLSSDFDRGSAHSNNAYFETLGRSLGFERVKRYANEFGLGELAGYQIQGEQLGTYPDEVLPAKLGGVGRMCSFGESVSMTPLQLGALVSAIANGGTLYYLQHPESAIDIAAFQPGEAAAEHRSFDSWRSSMACKALSCMARRASLRTNFSQFP